MGDSYFPVADPLFKTYLLENFDSDGVLSTKKAATVTRIATSGRNIRSMTELNTAFKHIVYLDCSDNPAYEVDYVRVFKKNE